MRDLAVTLGRLTDRVEHWVVALDERHEIGVVILIGDTLPVLVPVQHGLAVLQGICPGIPTFPASIPPGENGLTLYGVSAIFLKCLVPR